DIQIRDKDGMCIGSYMDLFREKRGDTLFAAVVNLPFAILVVNGDVIGAVHQPVSGIVIDDFIIGRVHVIDTVKGDTPYIPLFIFIDSMRTSVGARGQVLLAVL